MIKFGEKSDMHGKNAPFILNIKDTEDNELMITVALALTGKKGADIDDFLSDKLGEIFITSRPIYHDNRNVYKIVFSNYIIYQVRNESYTSYDKYEIREGDYFIHFKKSRLLDYIKLSTDCQILSDGEFYPARWEHYGIYCQNHIIDVVSTKTPQILKDIIPT